MDTTSISLGIDGGSGGALTIGGWEGVKLTGTNGDDTVNIYNGVPYNLSVNMLAGNDRGTMYTVRNPITPFVNNNIGITLGNEPGDQLLIYEPQSRDNYQINPNELLADEVLTIGGSPNNVLRVGPLVTPRLELHSAGDRPKRVVVDDQGAARTYYIGLTEFNDTVTFKNPSLLTRESTVSGNDGIDTVIYDDSARTTDATYEITTGTQSVAGTKVGVTVDSTTLRQSTQNVENVSLLAGSGNDRFNLVSAPLSATHLFAGGGNDTFNISGQGFNSAQLLPLVYMEGQAGLDTLTLDDSQFSTATYGILANSFSRSFSPTFFHYDFEKLNLIGGSLTTLGEAFNVYATSIHTSISAGDGPDTIVVGGITGLSGGGTVDNIKAYLEVEGDGGNDTIIFNDVLDTTGDYLHFDAFFAGHFPGDTFFGGSYVRFNAVENARFDLGSGQDSVTASMPYQGNVTFNGNGHPTGFGDSINFIVGTSTDPVHTITGEGSGRFDVSSGPSILYTGIEFHNIITPDTQAPILVNAASRKVHPTSPSPFQDIQMPLTGPVGIESRTGGVTQLILYFDEAVFLLPTCPSAAWPTDRRWWCRSKA